MGPAPADWYTDPEHPGMQRYWDGEAWSEQRRAVAAAPPPPPPPPASDPDGVVPGKSRRPIWKRKRVWIPTLVVLLVVASALSNKKKDSLATAPDATGVATTLIERDITPPPLTTAAPSTIAAPLIDNCLETIVGPCPFQVRMQNKLRKIVGDDNATLVVRDQVGEVGYFGIDLRVVDQLTKGMREDATRRDATDALKWAQTAAGDRLVSVVVRTDLKTQLGKIISNAAILSAEYPQSVLQQIVFTNFNSDDVFSQTVANIIKVHPVGCGLTDYC